LIEDFVSYYLGEGEIPELNSGGSETGYEIDSEVGSSNSVSGVGESTEPAKVESSNTQNTQDTTQNNSKAKESPEESSRDSSKV
jgi:hypothetical protein